MGQLTHTVSGNPVSFRSADKADISELKITKINAQNFNGYDHPWYAGGWHNMIPDGTDTSNGYVAGHYLDSNGDEQESANLHISEYFPVVAGETYTWGEGSESLSTAKNAWSMAFYDDQKNYISSVKMNKVVSHTITAPPGSAYARSSNSGPNTIQLQFIKGSTNEMYTPYRNICPFSSMTGMNVYNDPAFYEEIYWNQGYNGSGTTSTGNGITYTNSGNGTWTLTGTNTGSVNRKQLMTVSGITPGDILYFTHGGTVTGSSSTFGVCFSISGGNLTYAYASAGSMIKAGYAFNQFSIRTFANYAVPEGGVVLKPQWFNLTKMFGREIANTIYSTLSATDRVAWFRSLFPNDYYAGNTGTRTTVSAVNNNPYTLIPVSWETEAGSIYGGSLNLTTGELKKTHELLEFDGVTSGKMVTDKGSGNTWDNYYLALSDASLYGTAKSNWVSSESADTYGIACSHSIYGNSTNVNDYKFVLCAYIGSSKVFQPRLCFALSEGIDTIEKCNLWLKAQYDAGTPFQLWYALKSPVTYSLTATQLKAFADRNNIFINVGGDTEVTYEFTDHLLKKRMALQKPIKKNYFNINAPFQNPDNTTSGNSNKRVFTPNTYCVGLTSNNYFAAGNVNSYSVSGYTLSVISKSGGYGVGYAFSVTAGEKYHISAEISSTDVPGAYIQPTYYASDGSYLSFVFNANNTDITIPSDATTMVLLFRGHDANVEYSFSNITMTKV